MISKLFQKSHVREGRTIMLLGDCSFHAEDGVHDHGGLGRHAGLRGATAIADGQLVLGDSVRTSSSRCDRGCLARSGYGAPCGEGLAARGDWTTRRPWGVEQVRRGRQTHANGGGRLELEDVIGPRRQKVNSTGASDHQMEGRWAGR